MEFYKHMCMLKNQVQLRKHFIQPKPGDLFCLEPLFQYLFIK